MKKKYFRLNFIDIVFVLLIAALAMTAYYLSHRSSTEVLKTQTRSYVVELTDLEPFMANAVQVGDCVTDTVKNQDLGVVSAVESVPYTQRVLDEDNSVYVYKDVPNRITLLITIEAETLETENEITTASGYALRVGTFVNCAAGGLVGSGYILELDR